LTLHLEDTKEAMAMTKHWLRGILLGVSLALLLAGGVALAQTLTVDIDKDCLECWPGPYDQPIPDEYAAQLTLDGWDPTELLCHNVYLNGEPMYSPPPCGLPPAEPPPYVEPEWFWLPCDMTVVMGASFAHDLEVDANGIADYYGEWKIVVWQPGTDNLDADIWLFAEVCEEEFVPEAGTMVLLGSGLAGLAGYATLRLRSERALR
jgi:hypothetical protein